jgi:hypothetical protein
MQALKLRFLHAYQSSCNQDANRLQIMQRQTLQSAAAVFAAAAVACGGVWPLKLLLSLAAKTAATQFPAVGIGWYLLLVGGGFAPDPCCLEYDD